MDGLAHLVARPLPDLLPVRDARAPLRVLIASLAPGGAERIVLEWLAAERSRGRDVELAVLHPRRNALAAPRAIRLIVRGRESAASFVTSLAREWRGGDAPVSTHLVGDDLHQRLWSEGVRTVPTVHNSREGWRNDPATWTADRVPLVVACARCVRDQLLAAGCRVPVVVLRHRPRVAAVAFDGAVRARVRRELGIAPSTFLVGAAGALKPQKDYARAVDVLAALASRRDAALVVLGGVLDRAGLTELDRVMDRAIARGVAARLRFPGFVPGLEPYLAACDAWLNVSRYEGLSIAVQEALAAGLPVVATDVGGQSEIAHASLDLVASSASARSIAARLASHPIRGELRGEAAARAPRAWSLAGFPRAPGGPRIDTLFVTANLNAGGAQRSLANLALSIAARHRFALAVCGETTHAGFVRALVEAGVETFRPAATPDPFSVAESLLAHALAREARTVCFWNVDPRVKLLVAKLAPPALRVVDVSPGAYAFEEMRSAEPFAETVATSGDEYHARLDTLVLKYHAETHPACRHSVVIPNGVALRPRAFQAPAHPRFLVNGRIAPSKRLETILDAFAQVVEAFPRAELHLVGGAEERHRDYLDRIARAATRLPVRFRGPSFDHACLDEPFSAAVVLGTHQGSPNAVLEAMAASIPVIANDSGGTRELVRGGETGWLLREDADAGALAGAMLECLADEARARAMAACAAANVRETASLEAMARRYLEVLAPHEKMGAWNSAIAPPVPHPSHGARSPMTLAP